MKILIATDCYIYNLGGITASVLALCAGLRGQSRLTVVPNGMELKKYQRQLSFEEQSRLRRALGLNENTKVLVSISRISKEKIFRIRKKRKAI